MPSPTFDRTQYELRGQVPEVYTESQKKALDSTIARVNGQLDWNAQLLGFNGPGYWGKRIPTPDGSYKWKGLPETVSEKRAVQTTAFGVYAKNQPYSDRPAPFNRSDVGASADQAFDIFEDNGSVWVVPFGQPRGLLYAKTPVLFVGGKYVFNELVSATSPDGSEASFFVVQDTARRITSVRVLDANSTALQLRLEGSAAEPFLFFIEEWSDISDWKTDEVLSQFFGVWGNKGNAISSHALFDALDIHGFNEVESLTLDSVSQTITISDLLGLVGLVPGPVSELVTSHYNFHVEGCDELYTPNLLLGDYNPAYPNAIPAPTEFGDCQPDGYQMVLRQVYDPGQIAICTDPGPETSTAIGCNGVQYLFPPGCFIDNAEYEAPLGEFYLNGGDYDTYVPATNAVSDGEYDRDPFSACGGDPVDYERIIDFDDLVTDVNGGDGFILMTDPGAENEIEIVVEGGDYDGDILIFEGLPLLGVNFSYDAFDIYSVATMPCVEWIFDPSLDNSTYSPTPSEAAWMGTDDGEYDRPASASAAAYQSDIECVNATLIGGLLSFDDGFYNQIVQPNCDLLGQEVSPCAVLVNGGLYELPFNPIPYPGSSADCPEECGIINGGDYVYDQIPVGGFLVDGGILDTCTLYDNTEYDLNQPPNLDCESYNNGSYSNPTVVVCEITDNATFASTPYTQPPINDGVYNTSAITTVVIIATEAGLEITTEASDPIGADPPIVVPATEPLDCNPCGGGGFTPIDCTLDNGTFEGVAPSSGVDSGQYDRLIDPECVPCQTVPLTVEPCPVPPVRVRLDPTIFSANRWRMRPNVANSLTPLRLWKNRVLNVADPGLDTAFVNQLIADANTGPEPEASYRHFARLPVEYPRNGKFWNRATSVLANQSYFSQLQPPSETALPVLELRPLLYDETYFLPYDELKDSTTFYVEDYLISTVLDVDMTEQDAFVGASLTYEAPNRQSQFTLSSIVDYDAYAFRKLNPDGTRPGRYLVFSNREVQPTGYLETDLARYALRYTDGSEVQLGDSSQFVVPNVEFPDDPDRAPFANYAVCYAYFVADLSGGDDPVFDPTLLYNHRERIICRDIEEGDLIVTNENLVLETEDYQQLSTSNVTYVPDTVLTHSRYIFNDDVIEPCARPGEELGPPENNSNQVGTALITASAASYVECAGASLSLSSTLGIEGSRLYTWQINTGGDNWVDIDSTNPNYSGVFSPTLQILSLSSSYNGKQYRLKINWGQSFTLKAFSNVITLNVVPAAITITLQPANTSGVTGAIVTFSVGATSNDGGLLSYQWQVNTGGGWYNLTNGGDFSGVNTATLSLTASAYWNNSQFRAIVSSSGCASPVYSGYGTFEFSQPAALADYFVIKYTFTNGSDLDTRTSMLAPATSSAVGWGQGTVIGAPAFITWGGDNTGTGVESVLFNKAAFLAAYPGQTSIELDLRAMWYGSVGSNPVTVTVTSYAGGAMVQQGYTWVNPTATATYTNFTSTSNQITLFSQSASNPGQRVATMTLDFVAGTVVYGN